MGEAALRRRFPWELTNTNDDELKMIVFQSISRISWHGIINVCATSTCFVNEPKVFFSLLFPRINESEDVLVENPFGDSETNAIQVELDFWISCLAFEKRRFISLTCDRNVVKRFLLESPLIDIASFFRFCLSHHLDWCPKQQCVRWVWRSSRPESDRHRRLRRWWEQPVRKRPESKVKCGIT